MTTMDSPPGILSTIGKTPSIRLRHVVPDGYAAIDIKLEYLQPTGSYKDRMATAIIQEAERRGELRPGMTVIESTAGGTGTALAMVCRSKGYPFKAISSDAFSREKLRAMQIFGAELEIIPSQGGVITPDLVPRMIRRAEELSTDPNIFWARQFENRDALLGYGRLGEEILEQAGGNIDGFCGAVGTGGMLTGVSRVLKKTLPGVFISVLEPASSPVISKGVKGNHTIEGICPGFVPPLLADAKYDEVWTVDEAEARQMAKRLVAEEGILAGTSTGLNVVAAIRLAKQMGPGRRVVTVACDSGLKYMSAGLFD